MSSGANIPAEPVIPPHRPSVPADADWRKNLLWRGMPRTIPKLSPHAPLPLSFAQEGLWLLQQLEIGSPAFNRPLTLRFTGPLNEAALRCALQAIIERHEVLRTRFILREGRACPVVSQTHTLSLPHIELAHAGAQLDRARELAIEDSLRPFDLEHEFPLRATLLRLGQEDHILLVVAHHIAFDGWSARTFHGDLVGFYRQFHLGESAGLPDLPIQYSDFADWQRREFDLQRLAASQNFWKGELGGVLPLDLPTDRPRLSVQTYHGARVEAILPESLAGNLRVLGRQENATLFMVLLAAFQLLLARYSRMDDIAVGTPVAGRNRLETENLIGMFVNIIVLRSGLGGNPTFLELLARVRETCRKAYRHQDLPFSQVVRALNPQRDLGVTPLFQVMFNLENLPEPRMEIPGLRVDEFEIENPIADYELTLEILPANGQLRCHFSYNTDVFDRDTIERMAGCYQTMLEGIVAGPDRRVASLPLASEAERQRVLVDWNRTEADYPREATIHQLFQAQAARTPEATAFYSDTEKLNYTELDCRSNRLARYLIIRGVTPESRVGVCLDRSVEAIVAMLGILKAGAAFVPLDPAYPAERLAFMIHDARIPVVISRQEWKHHIAPKCALAIYLDADQSRIDAMESTALPNQSGPNDVAYVLYTSGSTGAPKGVMGLHRGAVNRFSWMWKTFPFTPGEVCCVKTSFNFVDSIWEIFGPSLQGIPSVVLSHETVADPSAMIQLLAEFGVTRIVMVPSLLTALLETEPNLSNCLPPMKLWISSGEAIDTDLCRRFYRAMPHATLLNLYGSTEVSADATAYVVPRNLDKRSAVPIGRPISNTRCYVLDAQLNPLPVGAVGNLYVGGDGLARGYCNRSDLTTESFIADPFSADPLARLYRTGDRAKLLADGNLEYLGRADDQVKVRGFRIELKEIEAVLALHPRVEASAAAVQSGEARDNHLVAYVVPRVRRTPQTSSELRDFVKQKLPGYMVPTEIFIVDSLPLTPSGKVDRRALRAKTTLGEATDRYVPPDDPVEWQLVKIWEDLLDARHIGIEHNFFECGGCSLLAIRMMNRIEQVYGKRLPLATLFAEPTILHLANCLRLESVRTGDSPIVPVQTGGTRPPFIYLHGDLGGGLYCRTLAQLLGPDQPLYGVMPSGVDGKPFLPSVEAMAAENVEHLLALQPEGPYFLGGYCNGGLVAYEMAQQLQKRSRKVETVILLDTWVPRNFRWLKTIIQCAPGISRSDENRRAKIYVRLRNYLVWTHHAYHQGPRALLGLYSQKAGRMIRRSLQSSYVKSGSQPANSLASDPLHFHRYPEFGRIISSYRPRPYDGRVILLRTRYLNESYPTDHTAGWGRFAPHLEIREMPGDHHNCLTEHLGDVGEHIGRCLSGRRATTEFDHAEINAHLSE